jgi:hypothetical protein
MKRAEIAKFPRLMTPGGRRPPFTNPGFQVPDQNEPTPENPVSQHKQFKGHMAGHHGHGRKP